MFRIDSWSNIGYNDLTPHPPPPPKKNHKKNHIPYSPFEVPVLGKEVRRGQVGGAVRGRGLVYRCGPKPADFPRVIYHQTPRVAMVTRETRPSPSDRLAPPTLTIDHAPLTTCTPLWLTLAHPRFSQQKW